jgi:hypothetical protein
MTGSRPRRPPRWLKMANRLNLALLSRGIGPATQRILTVAGRASGLPRRTPIAVVTIRGERFIVAGYPTADWVRNAQKAGRGTLSRGRVTEMIELVEVGPDQGGEVLREFLRTVRGGRSFLTVTASASDAEIRDAAREHPVFKLS